MGAFTEQSSWERLVAADPDLRLAMACLAHCGAGQGDPRVDPDDLLGEALLGYYEARRRFEPERGAAFSTFAYLVIRRRLRHFLGKETRFRSRHVQLPDGVFAEAVPDPAPALCDQMEAREREAELRAKIAALPARQARVVRVYHWGAYGEKSRLAAELGISPSRVLGLYGQALRRLRKVVH